jgi:hypothetical protein
MARRRSAPAPAPAPTKPARDYNGAGTWDEVATSSSTTSTDAREYEREMWRVRAAGLGVEVHEFVHRPPRSQSGTLVLLARRPPEAPQDWREQVGRALTGHVGIGEPPSLLRAWATTDDAADEGATLRQLVDHLRTATRCATAEGYAAARLAQEYAEILLSWADEGCTARDAALAILDAWLLGDRGVSQLWSRWHVAARIGM